MIKNQMCKNPLKLKIRPIDFNLGEKFIDRVSDFKMKLIFK